MDVEVDERHRRHYTPINGPPQSAAAEDPRRGLLQVLIGGVYLERLNAQPGDRVLPLSVDKGLWLGRIASARRLIGFLWRVPGSMTWHTSR